MNTTERRKILSEEENQRINVLLEKHQPREETQGKGNGSIQ